jgi:hypothetical protein
MSSPLVGNSIASVGESCRTELEGLVHRGDERDQPWRLVPAELLARFEFWADETGLFHADKRSLDYQLRKNATAQTTILQFLEAISANARLCKYADTVQVKRT